MSLNDTGEQQSTPRNHGLAWSKEDMMLGVKLYFESGLTNQDIEKIAVKLERTPGAIYGLLRKLEILEFDKYSDSYVQLPNVEIGSVYAKIEMLPERNERGKRRNKSKASNSSKNLSAQNSSTSANLTDIIVEFSELSTRAANAIKRMGISDRS